MCHTVLMLRRRAESVLRFFSITILSIAGFVGCGPSEAEVRAEFQAYVAGANKCMIAAECVVAAAACPLGCFAIVRADRKDDVERKARDLVADYEQGGQACVYDCRAPGELVCVDQRCGELTP